MKRKDFGFLILRAFSKPVIENTVRFAHRAAENGLHPSQQSSRVAPRTYFPVVVVVVVAVAVVVGVGVGVGAAAAAAVVAVAVAAAAAAVAVQVAVALFLSQQ